MRKKQTLVFVAMIVTILYCTIGCSTQTIETSPEQSVELEQMTESEPINIEPSNQGNNTIISNGYFSFSVDDYIDLLTTDNEYAALSPSGDFKASGFYGHYYLSSSGTIRLINYSTESGNTVAIFLLLDTDYLNSSHGDIFFTYLKQILDFCGAKDYNPEIIEPGDSKTDLINEVNIEESYDEDHMIFLIFPSTIDCDISVLPLSINNTGGMLADSDARETLNNYNENYQYEEMLTFIDSYISDNQLSEDDNVNTIKRLAESSASLLFNCTIENDKVTSEKEIHFNGIDQITRKINIVPLIQGNDFIVWFGFRDSDWIFFDKIEIKIDNDDNFTASFNSYDIDRDVDDGIIEKVKKNYPFDETEIERFRNSTGPIIRFEGDDKYKDHEITQDEIDALITLYYLRDNYVNISNMIFKYR